MVYNALFPVYHPVMTIDWLQIGIQTGLISGLLVGFLTVIRLRMNKWVSLGFANMMKKLNQAAEAENGPISSSPGSTLNLGGFKIDPNMVQSIMQLVKMAQSMGFLKGTGGSGGGFTPP